MEVDRESSVLTSYHLRQLEKHGYVREVVTRYRSAEPSEGAQRVDLQFCGFPVADVHRKEGPA